MNTERGHALFPDRLLSSIVLIPYQSDCQEGQWVATVLSFKADGLFDGLPDAFLTLSMQLANAADSVKRHGL